MIAIKLGIFVLVAVGTWWLTGADRTVSGESKRDHHLTRALRCVAVLFGAALMIWLPCIPTLIVAPIIIALVLRSSVSEIFTQRFLRVLDPALYDHREFDPHETQRCQDALADLIHRGRRTEAIQLCEEYKRTGKLDIVTIEDTLAFLGVEQPGRKRVDPLAEAARLRDVQKFAEAEMLLQSLLQKNPADHGAAIMLMRLYAQDLHQPAKAREVLERFAGQPNASASHVQFARRSIPEWATTRPVPADVSPSAPAKIPLDSARSSSANHGPAGEWLGRPQPKKSVSFDPATLDQMIADGSLGSAVEMLEHELQARPDDFALRLRLAEVLAVNCHDLMRAEKIIRQLEARPDCPPDFIAMARTKFAEWSRP